MQSGEGTALLLIVTGLLAVMGPLPIQVLWLIGAAIATLIGAVARRREDRPPSSEA